MGVSPEPGPDTGVVPTAEESAFMPEGVRLDSEGEEAALVGGAGAGAAGALGALSAGGVDASGGLAACATKGRIA